MLTTVVLVLTVLVLAVLSIGSIYLWNRLMGTPLDDKTLVNDVLAFVPTTVAAVSQLMKTKPEGVTDLEWNTQRVDYAVNAAHDYAISIGLEPSDQLTHVIHTAIEAEVNWLKSRTALKLP